MSTINLSNYIAVHPTFNEALTKAIEDVNANPGTTLMFPPNQTFTYTGNDIQIYASNTHINGNGCTLSIEDSDSPNAVFRVAYNQGASYIENFTMENLTIKRDKFLSGTNGINISSGNNICLRNVTVDQMGQFGILIRDNAASISNIFLDNVKVTNAEGVNLKPDGTIATSSIALETATDAIDGHGIFGLYINDCHFEVGKLYSACCKIHAADGVYINNTTFQGGADEGGLTFSNALYGHREVVTQNVYVNNCTINTVGGAGIRIFGYYDVDLNINIENSNINENNGTIGFGFFEYTSGVTARNCNISRIASGITNDPLSVPKNLLLDTITAKYVHEDNTHQIECVDSHFINCTIHDNNNFYYPNYYEGCTFLSTVRDWETINSGNVFRNCKFQGGILAIYSTNSIYENCKIANKADFDLRISNIPGALNLRNQAL